MPNADKNTISSMVLVEQTKFTEKIDQEILTIEKQRSLIFALVIGALAILFPLFSFSDFFKGDFSDFTPYLALELLLISLVGFELVAWYILDHFLKAGKRIPILWYYFSAFVEISFPTMMIYVGSHVVHAYALFHPPEFIYFLIIALSGLRMNFHLCLFSGGLAAIEYLLSAYYLINGMVVPHDEIHVFSPPMHLVKGLILLVAGIITGFVTNKLKTGFLKSFQSINEKNHIMGMFGQHVSPEVMEKLLHQTNSTEGEVQNVCVMFLDIRNFTTFSESRTPQQVVAYLNSLFDFMIDIINRNHGIINKFLGDGFMAVFGAPFSEGFDSCHAVNASREILQKLKEEVEAGRILPTEIGIGLHTGAAVTGNVGSSQRKEYTIIGDVVNLAARIESLNKEFHSKLLISNVVKEALGEAGKDAVSLGKVTVKGRVEPVEVFKLA